MMVLWQYNSRNGAQRVKEFHLGSAVYYPTFFCAELTDFLWQQDTRADAAIKDSKKHCWM